MRCSDLKADWEENPATYTLIIKQVLQSALKCFLFFFNTTIETENKPDYIAKRKLCLNIVPL